MLHEKLLVASRGNPQGLGEPCLCYKKQETELISLIPSLWMASEAHGSRNAAVVELEGLGVSLHQIPCF